MAFLFDFGRLSALAVELLQRTLVLPATVSRVAEADYSGTGGRVTIRVPQRRTANEQTTPGTAITVTAIDEEPVTLDVAHLYDATSLTDETGTLELVDFGRQVLQPMVAAVAEGAEDQIAAAMNGTIPAFDWTDVTDPVAVEADILEARRQLVAADVPAGGRTLGVSPSIAAVMLRSDKFTRVDASGSPSALRDATLGTLFGLNIVESNALTDGSAIAYHQSAYAYASLVPRSPEGASFAQTVTKDGIGLRVVADFDVSTLSDVIAVSVFAGGVQVDADRAVRIGPEESS